MNDECVLGLRPTDVGEEDEFEYEDEDEIEPEAELAEDLELPNDNVALADAATQEAVMSQLEAGAGAAIVKQGEDRLKEDLLSILMDEFNEGDIEEVLALLQEEAGTSSGSAVHVLEPVGAGMILSEAASEENYAILAVLAKTGAAGMDLVMDALHTCKTTRELIDIPESLPHFSSDEPSALCLESLDPEVAEMLQQGLIHIDEVKLALQQHATVQLVIDLSGEGTASSSSGSDVHVALGQKKRPGSHSCLGEGE